MAQSAAKCPFAGGGSPSSCTSGDKRCNDGCVLQDKFTELRNLMRGMESVVVAYSGGLDSAFVLAVAHSELGERALALTAVSPSLGLIVFPRASRAR
jgi:hypothetical protein